MTLAMPPLKKPSHMVGLLYDKIGNMNEISRQTEMSADLLWAIKGKPNYTFRTELYSKSVTALYNKVRNFDLFPDYIEEHITDLRNAYALSAKGSTEHNPAVLKSLLMRQWPLLNQHDGDFANVPDAGALYYLSGTMMLVADLRQIDGEYLLENKIARAIFDFKKAAELLENPGQKFRVLLSLAAAQQRRAHHRGKGFAPLVEILELAELKFLSAVQQLQITNSEVDALNALKLASVLQDEASMLDAEAALMGHNTAFEDINYSGWTPVTPVSSDPDLAYYHNFKSSQGRMS